MASLKKKFRSIKKLPAWVFVPLVLLLKVWKVCMRGELLDPHEAIRLEKFPIITVTWHNRLMFFPAVFTRAIRRRTSAIISASRDGQYVSDIVGLFGITAVRGSSSKRGHRALVEAIRMLRNGYTVSITPDGPRGPKYRMSQGPIILASKTGLPIVPITVVASSYWELPSWDRFQIPKPWGKLTGIVGEPQPIPPDLDEAGIEHWRQVIETQLLELGGDRT